MAASDNLNLPDQVRERLGLVLKRGLTEQPIPGLTARVQRRSYEEDRFTSRVELRLRDGAPHLDGYASVFDVPYDVAGGPPWGWTETIKPGTFTKALREGDDTRLLIEHEGLPLARTKSNTLLLDQDDVGLHSEAPALDIANPDVQRLASAMTRGDADEMSFAFRVTRQEWNEDYTERTITEVRLFDVSVVTFPANPATAVMLRGDDLAALAAQNAAEQQRSTKSLRLARAQIAAYRGRLPA
jgi:HK97 family phage prohead protease